MLNKRHRETQEAELDITSFMNLMIILVPVLLMSMVFARTTVLDLQLPELGGAPSENEEEQEQPKILEVLVYEDYLDVNYPAGVLLRRIPNKDVSELEGEAAVPGSTAHDFKMLTLILQEIKRRLAEQGVEKRDIFLLAEPNTNYQTIVSAMDAMRSYKAVVVTDVVNAELFPDVSLGDAPALPADADTGSPALDGGAL